MNLRVSNQQSFGWSKQSHIKMTLKALEKNSRLDNAEKFMLASFSKIPDEINTEKGYYNNAHFFFPCSKEKSFGKKSEKNNALAKFIEHYKNAFKQDNRKDFLYETGCALHFLQDANTPVHTEKGTLFSKIRDYYLHRNFERGKTYGAESKLDKFVHNYKPKKIDFLKLDDLFINTARFSAQTKFRVSRFNKSKWESIQQECFNYGISATKEFIDFMMNFLPKK